MNFFRRLLLLTLLVVPGWVTVAVASEFSGLWVGTADPNHVSEIQKSVGDLSFDLQLSAVKDREILIAGDASWQFSADGSEPDEGWQETGFDASGWALGQAPFSIPKAPTTSYFHQTFSVSDASLYNGCRIRLWRADGIVVYLNGAQILQNNLPSSYIGHETLALTEIAASSEDRYLELTLPATQLQDGNNLLAVEVHQAAQSNQELFFELELSATLVSPELKTLIPAGANHWELFDGDTPPAANWAATDYVTNGWSFGQAQFGYGDGDETTVLSYPSGQRPATSYFRKTFDAPNSSGATDLRLLLLRDDGAVVYLNGEEILRSNMPEGQVEADTPPLTALTSSEENKYLVYEIAAEELLPSGNVLAAEIHQHPAELVTGGSDVAPMTRVGEGPRMRLMFHVDAGGSVRLLKEAIQMYDEQNGRPVLVVDHELVPQYQGVAFRDGEPVGRRISAIGFDFEGHTIPCQGGFPPSAGAPLECSVFLPSNHPANPFLHRYHPDHDNWDSRYENAVEEAYPINRKLRLVGDQSTYPPNAETPEELRTPPPGWGLSIIGGQYRETLGGLHRKEIVVGGSFELRRVSRTAELIPAE